ncbi:MAG: hypothetical protein QNK37_15450 [Acidobacteriota bacterium]|nr:hypothetical protein [Acidobacteriota bacterium]
MKNLLKPAAARLRNPLTLLSLAALAQIACNGEETPGLLWAAHLLAGNTPDPGSENIGDSGGGSAPPTGDGDDDGEGS